MGASVSEKCRACIAALKTIVSSLSRLDRPEGAVRPRQVNDELERFSLWVGNIGALHEPASSMSLESRLRESIDVLVHILELLGDLDEVAREQVASGDRKGEIASVPQDGDDEIYQNEELELLEEIGACIARLFRVSCLIRQAAPTDLFAKALSRNRYQFNDQFDISHVAEKLPKLATAELAWLRNRLGRAITQRRHYLSYIQDHRGELEGVFTLEETPGQIPPISQDPMNPRSAMQESCSASSRPSTYFTKASSLPSGHTRQTLAVEEEPDSEDDTRSYTTISRSIDGELDCSTTARIPMLDKLQEGTKAEVECPFCFRMKRFKNERVWRRHDLSDLRSYVCTFPDCHAPYFGDINEWFRHEMQIHRVSYICELCRDKTFRLKERYLAHIRKRHPDILEDGEEQILLEIARKPLDQIPAHECPCCSGWVDRLERREGVASMRSDQPNHILTVSPTDFKRHLASHLEQLALFAIPIGSNTEDEAESNMAIEEDESRQPEGSDLSSLDFDSPRPSSPTSGEPTNIYQNLRFLLKIDYIQPAEDAPKEYPNGRWHPPTSHQDFQTTGSTGWLLRTPERLRTATDINGAHFGTCSLFYSSETGYYLGLPVDCRTSHLEEWMDAYGKSDWNRVMFNQKENLSVIEFFAQSISLAGHGSNNWVPELVPETYDLDGPFSQSPDTQLAGDISLIIAFIAFACPNMGDTAELTWVMNNCFQPPHWRPHRIPFSRLNRRGVVVNIRLDPSLPPAKSRAHLKRFQQGDYGPLIS